MPDSKNTDVPHIVRLCDAASVPQAEPYKVEFTDRPAIAVYNVEGKYYATDDRCSHGEASLSEGIQEAFHILCPFHMGGFDIRTGLATAAPCHIPIRAYDVMEKDGVLYLDLNNKNTNLI